MPAVRVRRTVCSTFLSTALVWSLLIDRRYVMGDFIRELIFFIQVFASSLEYDHSWHPDPSIHLSPKFLQYPPNWSPSFHSSLLLQTPPFFSIFKLFYCCSITVVCIFSPPTTLDCLSNKTQILFRPHATRDTQGMSHNWSNQS